MSHVAAVGRWGIDMIGVKKAESAMRESKAYAQARNAFESDWVRAGCPLLSLGPCPKLKCGHSEDSHLPSEPSIVTEDARGRQVSS
eukprot:3629187-Amphidinium_carterae.1